MREAASGLLFFFFNDTATTEIYTLSLHDALPIYAIARHVGVPLTIRDWEEIGFDVPLLVNMQPAGKYLGERSEEHTSELQSHLNLVCRLLLEKKKKTTHVM